MRQRASQRRVAPQELPVGFKNWYGLFDSLLSNAWRIEDRCNWETDQNDLPNRVDLLPERTWFLSSQKISVVLRIEH